MFAEFLSKFSYRKQIFGKNDFLLIADRDQDAEVRNSDIRT